MLAQALRSLIRPAPISWVGFFQAATTFEAERQETARRLRPAPQVVPGLSRASTCTRCGVLFFVTPHVATTVCVGCGNPKKVRA